jgi:hypothetical protein
VKQCMLIDCDVNCVHDVLDLTVSQLTVTLLLFALLENSCIVMCEYASIIDNLSIHYVNYNDICYKLLEIYTSCLNVINFPSLTHAKNLTHIT